MVTSQNYGFVAEELRARESAAGDVELEGSEIAPVRLVVSRGSSWYFSEVTAALAPTSLQS